MADEHPPLTVTMPAHLAGRRLDQALAELFPDYSRTRLVQWLDEGLLRVDGATPRARTVVAGGEHVRLELPPPPASEEVAAEPIPLSVVYSDATLLVIDKPAGLVVHPGAGNPGGTLMNALLHLDPALAAVPRAGLVHRLDKDTSGLLIVARTLKAHGRLVDALQARAITREYDAVCVGVMTSGLSIDEPIGRHPAERTRMAVRPGGRDALTHVRVRTRYRNHTRLRVRLATGRTHQIRVHLAHAGFPLVGDRTYGRRLALPKGAGDVLIERLRGFKRQALHAARLELDHPESGARCSWDAAPPADFVALIDALKADRQ